MNNVNKSIPNNSLNFLLELRARLIYSLIVFFFIFTIFLYFANSLYTLLAQPLLKFLPQGHLIATHIVSPFFVPFKLALMVSILFSVPFFIYQLWGFIAPALYRHEQRMIWPFLFLSMFLFYLGIAFAYFVIFPALFHFLAHTAPTGVILSPDISEYLDFTIKMLIVFGLLFEIPVVMVLLTKLGVVTRDRLKKMRSYAILGAFVLGMLLAPPDVLSQTVLAIPIYLLYELGLLMIKIF